MNIWAAFRGWISESIAAYVMRQQTRGMRCQKVWQLLLFVGIGKKIALDLLNLCVCVCDLNFWVIHCWRLALIICSSREKKIWAEKKIPASVSGSVNNLLDCKMWSLFSRRFCTFFSVCVLLNYVPTCANNENAALHLCMHSRAKYNVWIYTMQHSILQAGCTLHTLPAK